MIIMIIPTPSVVSSLVAASQLTSPPDPVLQIRMPFARRVAMFRRRSEQSLLLDNETSFRDRTPPTRLGYFQVRPRTKEGLAHLAPMKKPLPTARLIPTILKAELPDPTDSPWVPLDAEALLLAELAVAEAIEEDIFARR